MIELKKKKQFMVRKASKPLKVSFYTEDSEKVFSKRSKGATKPVKVKFYLCDL